MSFEEILEMLTKQKMRTTSFSFTFVHKTLDLSKQQPTIMQYTLF